MPATNDREKRQAIIDACRSMNGLGINQNVGEYQPAPWRGLAYHADQHAL